MTSKILIDLDSPSGIVYFMDRFKTMYPLLATQCKFTDALVFSTRHGWHVYLIADAVLDPATIVFYQALLRSDPKREFMNWIRMVKHGLAPVRWNVLFKEKRSASGRLLSKETHDVRMTLDVQRLIAKINKKTR